MTAAEKQRKALELRKAGVGYVRIAEQLGYAGPSGAYKAVTSALERTLREPADELRTLELERLDMALLAIAGEVRKGNLKAIERWVKLSESRRKLLGLDAPTKVAPTTPDGSAPYDPGPSDETAKLLDRLLPVLAARAADPVPGLPAAVGPTGAAGAGGPEPDQLDAVPGPAEPGV